MEAGEVVSVIHCITVHYCALLSDLMEAGELVSLALRSALRLRACSLVETQ